MSLAHPWWLLGLVPLASALAALWRWTPAAAQPGAALRGAAACAVVVALAGPHAGGEHPPPTLLVVDRSASIDAAATARERAWVRAARRDGSCPPPCRAVAFAEHAALVAAGSDGGLPSAGLGQRSSTDLAGALALAGGAVPAGGRIVVLGDGRPTTGDARAAVAQLVARGVRVDAVGLTAAPRADVAMTRLAAPAAVHAGDRLSLQLTARSAAATTATLTLERDGARLGTQRVRLRAGDTPLVLDDTAPAAGWHRYRVAVTLAGDRHRRNDALTAAVRVARSPRTLLIEGAPGRGTRLAGLLRRAGVGVRVRAPSGLPGAAAGLAGVDSVVLADVPAPALAARQVAALQTAVRRDALGLLVLGGPHSLSLGRYAGTALDALLPARSIAPGSLRPRALALGLVLDRSSSMANLAGGDESKLTLAQAAARSALLLARRDEDELSVVAFDAVATTLFPLRRLSTDAAAQEAEAAVDTLDTDGGTDLVAGLAAAVAQLRRATSPVKHLVLITDGVSEHRDATRVIAELRRLGGTLSTIALGPDADEATLRRLARDGGGRFAAAPDARQLPRILDQELQRSVPSVAARGRLPVRATAASPILSGLDGRPLVPVRGLVVTRVRPGALAPLTARVQGRDVLVLAQWQTGLGRVATWTPGTTDWAGGWLTGGQEVLSDALRWVQRAVPARPAQPALSLREPHRVVLDPLAAGGAPLDLALVTAGVQEAGGVNRSLRFTQDAPSHYAAPLGDGPTAAHVDTVTVSVGAAPPVRALLAVPYPAEDRPATPGASVLPGLVAATGGRLLPAGDPAAAAPGDGTALWPFLAALAAALTLASAAADARRR